MHAALQVTINLLEHVNDMHWLMVGRILGGISTSLLFSAFEAWMVTEHRKQGFPEEWLGITFGHCAGQEGGTKGGTKGGKAVSHDWLLPTHLFTPIPHIT